MLCNRLFFSSSETQGHRGVEVMVERTHSINWKLLNLFDYQSVTTLQKGKQVKTNKGNLTTLFFFSLHSWRFFMTRGKRRTAKTRSTRIESFCAALRGIMPGAARYTSCNTLISTSFIECYTFNGISGQQECQALLKIKHRNPVGKSRTVRSLKT